MNRDVNNGIKYNSQKDMIPLFGEIASKDKFEKIIAMEAGVAIEDIISTDLFLYIRECGTIWGADNEFISSPRLDDVMCAYSCMKALIEENNENKSIILLNKKEKNEKAITNKLLNDFKNQSLRKMPI